VSHAGRMGLTDPHQTLLTRPRLASLRWTGRDTPASPLEGSCPTHLLVTLPWRRRSLLRWDRRSASSWRNALCAPLRAVAARSEVRWRGAVLARLLSGARRGRCD